jgi:hypothetical protein
MAAEFIGMIQEAIKTFDQQGNAGGSCIFFADQQKECGGSAERWRQRTWKRWRRRKMQPRRLSWG